MKRLIVGVVLWVLLSLQAIGVHGQTVAPTTDAPLMGSEASTLSDAAKVGETAIGEETRKRILVIGDGLAGGLGAGMSRMLEEQSGFEILNRFNKSSGLARREVYDWSAAIKKIVATKPVDAVVVLVGVNDRQEIRQGNFRFVFKSPDWVQGYQANVDGVIEAVAAAQAKLYWVSIPPMADTAFDADMQYISSLHRERVAKSKGQYIDVRQFFVTPDGAYVDRGPDEAGVERKLREGDGVSFMRKGNNRFGQLVLAAINTLGSDTVPASPDAIDEPTKKPEGAAPIAADAQGVTVVTEPPSFGQTGLDGETITFRADTLSAPTPQQRSVAQRTDGQLPVTESANQVQAKAGSNAEKLLVQGVASPAPAGRFDDYTVAAPAVAN